MVRKLKLLTALNFSVFNYGPKLKREINVDQSVSSAQQRLYFLRRLRSCVVSQVLMVKFYRAVIESVLTFSFAVWYNGATAEDRNRLARIVRVASRIVGLSCQLWIACTELEL